MLVSTKQVQQIKCDIGFYTIIIQFNIVPNKKKNQISFPIPTHWGKVFNYF